MGDKEVNNQQQQCSIKNKQIRNKQVNRQQQLCNDKHKQNTQITINNLFTFIEASRRQVHWSDCLPCNLKDNTKQAKDSERILSVLCEDTLHVKRNIVVWRSIEQLLLCTQKSVKNNNS